MQPQLMPNPRHWRYLQTGHTSGKTFRPVQRQRWLTTAPNDFLFRSVQPIMAEREGNLLIPAFRLPRNQRLIRLGNSPFSKQAIKAGNTWLGTAQHDQTRGIQI